MAEDSFTLLTNFQDARPTKQATAKRVKFADELEYFDDQSSDEKSKGGAHEAKIEHGEKDEDLEPKTEHEKEEEDDEDEELNTLNGSSEKLSSTRSSLSLSKSKAEKLSNSLSQRPLETNIIKPGEEDDEDDEDGKDEDESSIPPTEKMSQVKNNNKKEESDSMSSPSLWSSAKSFMASILKRKGSSVKNTEVVSVNKDRKSKQKKKNATKKINSYQQPSIMMSATSGEEEEAGEIIDRPANNETANNDKTDRKVIETDNINTSNYSVDLIKNSVDENSIGECEKKGADKHFLRETQEYEDCDSTTSCAIERKPGTEFLIMTVPKAMDVCHANNICNDDSDALYFAEIMAGLSCSDNQLNAVSLEPIHFCSLLDRPEAEMRLISTPILQPERTPIRQCVSSATKKRFLS